MSTWINEPTLTISSIPRTFWPHLVPFIGSSKCNLPFIDLVLSVVWNVFCYRMPVHIAYVIKVNHNYSLEKLNSPWSRVWRRFSSFWCLAPVNKFFGLSTEKGKSFKLYFSSNNTCQDASYYDLQRKLHYWIIQLQYYF